MITIDAETRMAYVDGELDEVTRRRVERAIADDPRLAEAVARDRALRERLQARFAPYAEQPIPQNLRQLLETDAASIVTVSSRKRGSSKRRFFIEGFAIAASLVLGIGIGTQMMPKGPVANSNGGLEASGRLAVALGSQLASTQPADAQVRIGFSFRDQRGMVCRTFNAQTLNGIACRDGDNWRLVRTVAGEHEGAYRQASSGALMGDVEEMMAGGPFSSQEEVAAKHNGWK